METLYIRASTAVEIADRLSEKIAARGLAHGEALPPVRALAKALGVSPSTVSAAYGSLKAAGLIVTDGRRGTRVADEASSSALPATSRGDLHDLASGNVDGELLPRADPHWLVKLTALTGYDAAADDPELVETARRWMGEQGVPNEAIAVCNGALDAIERALRQVVRPGSRVAVEDPCWPPLLALLESLRLVPVPLPVDSHGVNPSPDVLKGISACVLTPRAQNPTGVAVSAARLAKVIRLIDAAPRCLLILDDYWGLLAAERLPSLRWLPARWLYVGSLSKALGPDLRVAVVSGDKLTVHLIRQQQSLGPRWVSLMVQRLAANLWRTADAHGSLGRAAEKYGQRRAALVRALNAEGVVVPESGIGLHVWLSVPDESTIVQRLAASGWSVQAGRPFRLRTAPAVRINAANLGGLEAERFARDFANAVASGGWVSA
jgi:DNA-binding transcriptional MocR family regulator